MNNKMKKLFFAFVAVVVAVCVASCGPSGETKTFAINYFNGNEAIVNPDFPTQYTAGTPVALVPATNGDMWFRGWYDNAEFEGKPLSKIDVNKTGDLNLYAKFEENADKKDTSVPGLTLGAYKSYILHELDRYIELMAGQLTEDQTKAVKADKEAAVDVIKYCKDVTEVQAAYLAAQVEISSEVPFADGFKSYISLSQEEKTEILGILEAYGVDQGMTGVSLFENGGYQMFNPRVTLGTEEYIIGYGFGTLAEGNLTADLETESNAAWKRYYHTINAQDPGTVFYHNDKGSEVGDFYGYIGASFYTNFMNKTKDGYDWVPELAKENPIPVNSEDGGKTASVWRFEVRTGAKDGLKYNTNSTIPSRAAFDGREVALEDYLTPFKLMLTQSNGLYRGSELANTTSGAIKGAKSYYTLSTNGFDAEAWAKVGLKAYEEDGKAYFEVEYTRPYDEFYARYYISSSLYMPLPQEFVDLTTVVSGEGAVTFNLFGFNADKTETPVDNSLSLGAYTLERWDTGEQIVYKKNPYYVYADTKYQISGVHIRVLTAAQTDTEAGIKEFLAGKTDASGIPMTYLAEYRDDPRTKQFRGDSNFKLNMNSTDAETWEYLFGVNGTYSQTASVDKYWEVEPFLSNSFFTRGLSLSIDRLDFCSSRGSVPSVDYLAPNYLSDPANGIAYASTDAHKFAIKELIDDAPNGFNISKARTYFQIAIAELEAEGKVTPGTPENPHVINLEIAWQTPSNETTYHNQIKQYFEDAFNDPSVSGGRYKLECTFWVSAVWSDVYYAKMLVGQYDIGFGSISGNSLDPLGFMNVLSTDPITSGEFTLNWGTLTNDPVASTIVYDGMRWSYDALFYAANSMAIVKAGKNVKQLECKHIESVKNPDGTVTGTVEAYIGAPNESTVNITEVDLWSYDENDGAEVEFEFSRNGSVVTIVITVPAELAEKWHTNVGYDVYFDVTIDGYDTTSDYNALKSWNFWVDEPTPAE